MDVSEVVPFFAVKDMEKSLAFYVKGLGFRMEGKWVDEGVIRWCMVRIGKAAVMLQEFRTEGPRFTAIRREQGRRCFALLFLRRRRWILPGHQVSWRRRL